MGHSGPAVLSETHSLKPTHDRRYRHLTPTTPHTHAPHSFTSSATMAMGLQVLSETQEMERKCSREYIAYEKAKKRSADAKAKNPGKKF